MTKYTPIVHLQQGKYVSVRFGPQPFTPCGLSLPEDHIEVTQILDEVTCKRCRQSRTFLIRQQREQED